MLEVDGKNEALPGLLEKLRTCPPDDALWETLRTRLFPQARINLNPGTLGTPFRSVVEATRHFYDDELEAYPLGQYQRGREQLQRARGLATRLFGHDPAQLAITGSTTQVMNLLTLSLYAHLLEGAGPGGSPFKVLTSSHEHYGGVAGFERHPGFEVLYLHDAELGVASPAGLEPLARVLECTRPAVLLLSQVTWTRGQVLDIAAIGALVRQISPRTWFVVDATQALGLIEPPWAQADLVVSSAHKWLFGPNGVGFLWLSKRARQSLQAISWAGEPLDARAPTASFELAGGQDFSLYAGLCEALELHLALGLPAIRARGAWLSHHFLARLCAGLEARGIRFEVPDPITGETRREPPPLTHLSGMFCVEFLGHDPYPAYASLNLRGVHVKCIKSTLHGGQILNLLRFGVPFYESPGRLELAADLLLEALEAPHD